MWSYKDELTVPTAKKLRSPSVWGVAEDILVWYKSQKAIIFLYFMKDFLHLLPREGPAFGRLESQSLSQLSCHYKSLYSKGKIWK